MRKISIVLFGLLSIVGVAAQAGEFDASYNTSHHHRASSVSSESRAEVKRETLRAIQAGEVTFGDVAQARTTIGTTGRTRTEVRLEARQALAAGEVPFGEVGHVSTGTATVGRTRSEVRAETLMALKERGLKSERDLYSN